MSEYFEIAYAAASNRLCLFTGTGFSKAVSENLAPSWQQLLELLCDLLPDKDKLRSVLFPENSGPSLPLEEVAQIIDIELQKIGKSAHEEAALVIKKIKPKQANKQILEFINNNNELEVVTTNFDKLFETLASSVSANTITPGLPIPRSSAKVQVYHIHGSVDSPRNMVVTSDDYFQFLNNDSYFSRKLSTILHENVVVILGYSLGDTNLKSILSDYKGFSRSNAISGNIFFVSKNAISQYIKDYYAHSFAIRVIDNTEIETFFEHVNSKLPEAKKCADRSNINIKNVIDGSKQYRDEYIQLEDSFFEIVAAIIAVGQSLNDEKTVRLLGSIIDRKIKFTSENGAWSQYGHLAKWLAYLATLIDLSGTSIESAFLDATLRSMESMSKKQKLGYSWQAYKVWSDGWSSIKPTNRMLIRTHVEKKSAKGDAIDLVKRL